MIAKSVSWNMKKAYNYEMGKTQTKGDHSYNIIHQIFIQVNIYSTLWLVLNKNL